MKANDKPVGQEFHFTDPQGQKQEHRPLSYTTLKGRNNKGGDLEVKIPRHPASAYKLEELSKHFSK